MTRTLVQAGERRETRTRLSPPEMRQSVVGESTFFVNCTCFGPSLSVPKVRRCPGILASVSWPLHRDAFSHGMLQVITGERADARHSRDRAFRAVLPKAPPEERQAEILALRQPELR